MLGANETRIPNKKWNSMEHFGSGTPLLNHHLSADSLTKWPRVMMGAPTQQQS